MSEPHAAAAGMSTECRLTPMGGTTTIRVDMETRELLHELASASGDSLIATVRAAAVALRRQRFAEQVAGELDALRSDPEAWADYLAEADQTSVSDGVT